MYLLWAATRPTGRLEMVCEKGTAVDLRPSTYVRPGGLIIAIYSLNGPIEDDDTSQTDASLYY